jgi:acyl carrier protein phosphodiesterase
MNFLAHLYLSREIESIVIGNFIADHVKGNKVNAYSEEIQSGILLHRAIDHYTDTHEVVKYSMSRIRDHYQKYSGVVVDMYYDHFLSKYWDDYSDIDLKGFTGKHYRMLMRNYLILPAKSKRILPFMAKDDWLYSYQDLRFLQWSFNGLASRTKFESNMKNAVNDLVDLYDDFEGDFRSFFPELISFSDKKLEELQEVILFNKSQG